MKATDMQRMVWLLPHLQSIQDATGVASIAHHQSELDIGIYYDQSDTARDATERVTALLREIGCEVTEVVTGEPYNGRDALVVRYKTAQARYVTEPRDETRLISSMPM